VKISLLAMAIPKRYGNEVAGMFYDKSGWPMQSCIAWYSNGDGPEKAFYHQIGKLGCAPDSDYTLTTIFTVLKHIFRNVGFKSEVVIISDGYVPS